MNSKILITFATESGSTAELAQTLGEELSRSAERVDITPIPQVTNLDDYDTVIIGAPMIMGWHRQAVAFIKANANQLAQKTVAYFFTSLNLTRTGEETIDDIPIYVDPNHGAAPQNPQKLNFMEKHTAPQGYVQPVLQKAPQVKPKTVACFGGKLDYSHLAFPAKIFVKYLIRGQEGDFRNMDAVREWGRSLEAA